VRRATDGIDKQMDEQTDTRPLHREFVDPATHNTHAGGVKNSILIPDQSTVAAISLHYRGHVGLVTYLRHKNSQLTQTKCQVQNMLKIIRVIVFRQNRHVKVGVDGNR